jgi:phospholipid-binding lipoprotein MlaA
MQRLKHLWVISVLVGCSTPLAYAAPTVSIDTINVDANANQPAQIKDPFESINRKIFSFNNFLDQNLLLPAAKTYQKITPPPVRKGVSSFFGNLSEPWSGLNHLLQGDGKASLQNLSRFTINTITTLGLADPAAVALNIPAPSKEDFGQTLGVWGVKSGPYLMLPLLGPSTLRDTAGLSIDTVGNPQSYLESDEIYMALLGLRVINTRADLIGVEDLVNGDQYALLRDVYLQRRQFQIQNTASTSAPASFDDSFGDEEDPAPSAEASSVPDQPAATVSESTEPASGQP